MAVKWYSDKSVYLSNFKLDADRLWLDRPTQTFKKTVSK